MFPHLRVLRDHVLLCIREYLWTGSFMKPIVNPKFAPFLVVGNQYTLTLVDAPVYLFGFQLIW